MGIETVCPQRLDVSLAEDKSRVCSVSGVAGLGVLSRISQPLVQAECRRAGPVGDKPFPGWSHRLQRRRRPTLNRLLERRLPR